jgi:hypothetical protein
MKDLFKLPLHDSTKTVLKRMGIVFLEGDDSYNVRGFNAELNKWGNYEITMETTMELELDDEEIADFYYVIKFNEKEVCRLQATPQLLAVFQLFTMDRISEGKMAESLLELGDDELGIDLP